MDCLENFCVLTHEGQALFDAIQEHAKTEGVIQGVFMGGFGFAACVLGVTIIYMLIFRAKK